MELTMSEGMIPEQNAVTPEVRRLRTKAEAAIYVQHVMAEHLLTQLQGWNAMRDTAETDEDRHELGLIINTASDMEKVLRDANRSLARLSSPVVVPGRG
jgi:hypothetical protein